MINWRFAISKESARFRDSYRPLKSRYKSDQQQPPMPLNVLCQQQQPATRRSNKVSWQEYSSSSSSRSNSSLQQTRTIFSPRPDRHHEKKNRGFSRRSSSEGLSIGRRGNCFTFVIKVTLIAPFDCLYRLSIVVPLLYLQLLLVWWWSSLDMGSSSSNAGAIKCSSVRKHLIVAFKCLMAVPVCMSVRISRVTLSWCQHCTKHR